MGKSLGKESPCCWGRGSLRKLGVAGTSREGLGVGRNVVGGGSELQEVEIRARGAAASPGSAEAPIPHCPQIMKSSSS